MFNKLTTFSALANETGLIGSLDAEAHITVFIPTNDAFSSAGITSADMQAEALLKAHVVSDDIARYLPWLRDGDVYNTLANTSFSIAIRNGYYFVNDAKIVHPNLVLSNGVAHVIDRVSSLMDPSLL